jgi:hypothetical protein
MSRKRTKDTLMVILTSIYQWKALVTAFSFLLLLQNLYGMSASYKQRKDCAISKMCHGTSMIQLRIAEDTVSVTFVFVICGKGQSDWPAVPPSGGKSISGFLTIQS